MNQENQNNQICFVIRDCKVVKIKILFIKIMKNKGPKTEPCGTPTELSPFNEAAFSTFT